MKRLRSSLIASSLLSAVGAQSLPENDPSVPGNAPKFHSSVISCTDGTFWNGATFQTIPGLSYLLESSDDLVNWTAERSVYGFGQTETVLMREAAPPAELPATQTPLATTSETPVFLMVRKATGGGCVVTWPSLDGGQSVTWHFPALSPNVALGQLTYYVNTFDGFLFNLMCWDAELAPPPENPAAGANDAAMLAVFESRFAQINEEAANSIASSLAGAHAAPPAIERRFWRVQTNWSHDGDGDGTPDWLEIQNMMAADGDPLANAFNADVNGDGVPDGTQMNSDRDAVPDDRDADMKDPLIDWSKTDPFRYALFAINNPASPPFLGIDDFGTVYGQQQYWRSGTVANYMTPQGTVDYCCLAMNDSGHLLGRLFVDTNGDGHGDDQNPGDVRWWKDAAILPKPILANLAGQPTQDFPLSVNFFEWGLTKEGRFITATQDDRHAHNDPDRSKLWKIDANTEAATVAIFSGHVGLHVQDPGYSWYWRQDGKLVVKGFGSGEEVVGAGYADHLTIMPSGTPIFSGGDNKVRVRKDGAWKTPKGFSEAVDIAGGDVCCAYLLDGKIWQNGIANAFTDWAPGLSSEMQKGKFSTLDASSMGFLLASRVNVPSAFEYGNPPPNEPTYHMGAPVYVLNPGRLPGVDDVSFTAQRTVSSGFGGGGWQDRAWVMAPASPAEGEGTTFNVHVPHMENVTVTLLPSTLRVGMDTNEFSTGNSQDIKITASGETTEDVGMRVRLKRGADPAIDSQNVPIGVKIMKKRTVKMTVHPMILRKAGKSDNPPDLLPCATQVERTASENKLKGFLDSVYAKQVNVMFQVTVLPPEFADYDKGGPNDAGDGLLTLSGPASELSLVKLNPISPSPNANLDVWVVGGVDLQLSNGEQMFGFTIPGAGVGGNGSSTHIIVDGDFATTGPPANQPIPQNIKEAHFPYTIAHEIGHVMIGPGHPNEVGLSTLGKGPAPLVGTDQMRRLMRKGGVLGDVRAQLVKTEWDEIEKWLKDNVDAPPTP